MRELKPTERRVVIKIYSPSFLEGSLEEAFQALESIRESAAEQTYKEVGLVYEESEYYTAYDEYKLVGIRDETEKERAKRLKEKAKVAQIRKNMAMAKAARRKVLYEELKKEFE